MGSFAPLPAPGRGASSPRLLHVIQSAGLGGSESVFATIAEGLSARGWHVVCATGEEGWLVERVRECGVQVETIPGLGRGRAFELRSVLALRRLIESHGIDIVHAMSFPTHLYAAIAARLAGRRCIVNVRNAHHDTVGARRRAVWRWGIGPLADAVVTVSEQLATEVRRLVLPDKVVCIPNGMDTDRFVPGDREAARAKLGLSEDAVVIGTVGNTRPVKGHLDLLRAASIVVQRVPTAVFILVGAEVEPAAGQLRRFCRERGLEDRVMFLGPRRDVEEVLPAMDIFSLPSLSEGMSGALLQAMAAGLPAVATAVGGNREVVVEDETGLLVPARNPEALARALVMLAAQPSLCRRMGAAGRQRVQTVYGLETMIGRYDALHRAVLHRSPLTTTEPPLAMESTEQLK